MLDPQTQFELTQRYPVTQAGDTVPGWIGLQGFLLGFFLTVIGVVAAAVFSSPENRKTRAGWAIGGFLVTLTAAIATLV